MSNMAPKYQIRGHQVAHIDPLGINTAELMENPIKFIYDSYNFGK